MSEGDEPESKPKPSSDPDRAAALARKLTGGRQSTATPDPGRKSSGPLESSRAEQPLEAPPPLVEHAPDSAVAAKTAALLAARRGLVNAPANEPARPERPKTKPAARKPILALGALLLLLALAAGGWFAKRAMFERSSEGRVHAQLLAWEFAAPGDAVARENAFAELDRMGPSAIPVAIDKLADASVAEAGSSKSTRSVQHLAHFYLMHFATAIKAPPPKEATDLGKALFDGAAVSPAQWLAARDAWRTWYADQQAKGAAPK